MCEGCACVGGECVRDVLVQVVNVTCGDECVGVYTCAKCVEVVPPSPQCHSPPPSQPPSLNDECQHWTKDHPFNVDVPTKFISYVAMGTVAIEAVPYLFNIVGV